MPWTERQQGLLRAMGLRVWAAPAAQPAAAVAEAAEAAPAPASTTAPAAVTVSMPSRPSTPARAAAAAAPAAAAPPAVPLRADLAALGWPELRDSVAACRACGLCESRTQTVFGVGHPQAHWMVVGEAPGEEEDRQGEPFVGASGQLLDRMLAALQLTRAADGPPERSVYIANTLKCRPPRNRNPSAEELAQCEPFLVRQIQLLQPRIILAMGRFAVQALLRSDAPIGRLRGQVHRYQGVPLVVSYHPAYLLRSLGEKAKAWEDLCLAADTVQQAEGRP
jgi:uracil-DNA glycosylase